MRYNRKLFNYDSRSARVYLLLTHGDCMLDVYNGRILKHDEPFDAEHICPLYGAWLAGFREQYLADREKALVQMEMFANDPRNLAVVGASSNRSRSAKTLWNWSPLCLTYVPVRNAIVRELYEEFGLKLTAPQKWAMVWADKKILETHKHGIHLGKVRSWLIEHGFHSWLLPF